MSTTTAEVCGIGRAQVRFNVCQVTCQLRLRRCTSVSKKRKNGSRIKSSNKWSYVDLRRCTLSWSDLIGSKFSHRLCRETERNFQGEPLAKATHPDAPNRAYRSAREFLEQQKKHIIMSQATTFWRLAGMTYLEVKSFHEQLCSLVCPIPAAECSVFPV